MEKRFKKLVKAAHPDTGGSEEQFLVLQHAREAAMEYFEGNNA